MLGFPEGNEILAAFRVAGSDIGMVVVLASNENKNRSYCSAILARKKVSSENKTPLQSALPSAIALKREKLLPLLGSGAPCANNESRRLLELS
jgi:hypothetical protein